MWLIVGLGNPGQEYDGTRHNVGFAVVDAFAAEHDCVFRRDDRLHADVGTCPSNIAISLAKPRTFMNESGRAVAALVQHGRSRAAHQNDPLQLLVIHDDLDLPVGMMRLSSGGSSGGQKGVQSVIDALSTEDFLRLRIGIGPNTTPDGHRIPAETFVLQRFTTAEHEHLTDATRRSVHAMTILVSEGLAPAQQIANGTSTSK